MNHNFTSHLIFHSILHNQKYIIIAQSKLMFTGAIKLAQIDDYISPSQNCIQPKIMKPSAIQAEKATVTLNDCLACSGCITSAESILVQQMSVQKLLAKVACKDQDQIIYLCISPQSLLGLAKNYEVSPVIVIQCLIKLFNKYFPTVKGLIDLQKGILICHQLIWQEFMTQNSQHNKTILCSECPGFVCYAQKTLTNQVTDLMSHIKSPQQILGNLIKTHYLKTYGKQELKKVFMVGVMPCYDKKLEAIRFGFDEQVKQIDLTITTGQLRILIEQILKRNQFTWKQLMKDCSQLVVQNQKSCQDLKKQQACFNNDQFIQRLCFDIENIRFLQDQSSNGYLSYLLSRLQVKYQSKQIKNSDFVEYSFVKDQKQLKMAKCYGFRNIQKVVQMIKKKKCPYLYVEIMACPSGCYGGGGQIKNQNQKPKQTVYQLDKIRQIHQQKQSKQIIVDQNTRELHRFLDKKSFQVNYKPIQKTLQANVSDW